MSEDYSGYKIVRSLVYRDSLDRSSLHVNVLRNGTWRIVIVTPEKDGIDSHHVFEINPKELMEELV